jgi:tRNA pseudouridine38-40 synthase
VRDVLRSRDRSLAAATFGPEGLYLASIEYEPKWQLPRTAHAPLALPLEA